MTVEIPSSEPRIGSSQREAEGSFAGLTDPVLCATCLTGAQPSFWRRYRDFFLAPNTIITITCGVLLLAGAVASFAFGAVAAANVLWAASALVGGAPIFVLAARGIVKGDLTAGVMVSVAMIGALLIGEFSAAALVAFMMMFGEILENFTMARANNALRELARLLPEQAAVLRDGQEVAVPVAQVGPGDLVLVRNGGRIPVDGRVESGGAAVDQSTITGEAIPVDKHPGDRVFAGTLNVAGTLQIRAEKVGQETTLGTVVKLVAEAQRTQAPVQRLANRYAQYLVPITFSLAVLTFLITGEALRAVTVLVVVCPCALVLATPTALVAAIANAARRQVVVKTGAGLEALGRVRLMAFDKTGTLTLGRPQVVRVVPLDGLAGDDILRYAAGAEHYSEHPIGRAIYAAAAGRGLDVPAVRDVTVLTGSGVRGEAGGKRLVVGQAELLVDAGVPLTPLATQLLDELQRAGYTAVPVALDERVAGVIALADTPRPGARDALDRLQAMGVRTVLISGDNPAVVANLAGHVGVGAYHAGVLPGQKLEIIRGLQAGAPGKQPGASPRSGWFATRPAVAFVGDGVNDAPALAAADVGIAMGVAGTDVAIETGQVALMTDDLMRLPDLLALSRETLRTIRICVAFSMSMNVLALLLSMLGIIGPPAGALMHELSALPVLAYSARLVAFRPRA